MALTVIKSTGVDLSANTVTITTLYQGNLPIVCNDISTQFDGQKTVFSLMQDQSSINTVVDTQDIQLTVNGLILAPYVAELRYPWLTEYDSYKGFRVVNSTVIIYNAPDAGDTCVAIVYSTSQNKQIRRYPYSAISIALGD